MAAEPFSFDVESAAQLFQEEGVVLLVLRPKNVSVSDGSGIFPIDIQAIQLVVAHKLNSTIDEGFSARGGQHHVRESSRPPPSTHRHYNMQLGIHLLQIM